MHAICARCALLRGHLENLVKVKLYRLNPRFIQSKTNTLLEPEEVQTQVVSENDKSLPDIQKLPDELSKYERFKKDPTNEPFVKNLFLGKFDKAMLVFPDISNNQEVQTLNNFVQVLEMVFKEKVDSSKIDKDGSIPEDTMKDLKTLGLFGLLVPQEYGGLELTATKHTRLTEVLGQDSSIAITLAAHHTFALMGIVRYGTEDQKRQYLPSLSSGHQKAALCLTEKDSGSDVSSIQTRATLSDDGSQYYINGYKTYGSDVSSIETRATLSDDGSHYYINGHKTWVVNGGSAEVFVVFAKTEVRDETGETKDKLTGFIVERGHGGVKSSPSAPRFGVRGADICDVSFENTPVPVDNILGEKGGGFKVAMNILNSGRYSMGAAGAGLLKSLINNLIEHVTTRTRFGKPLANYKLIKDKLTRLAVNAYAMESVSYLTTTTLDKYENPDVSVEAAIVKVFSSERLWSSINEVMDMYGAAGLSSDLPLERHLRDSRVNLVFEGSNDILRLYIALTGLQHAGKELQNFIKKKRNPLDNPKVYFTHYFNKSIRRYQFPRLTLRLDEEVHMTLRDSARNLETNVRRFEYVIQEMLTRYGNDIKDEQIVLHRLSEVAILLYTMTACVSRSSRSMCIGLANNDDEILMTNIFCYYADRKIYRLMEELVNGPNYNMDANKILIADKMLKQHKYTPTHALERNW